MCTANCQLNVYTTFFSCQHSSSAYRNTLASCKIIFETTGLKKKKNKLSQNFIFSDRFPRREKRGFTKANGKNMTSCLTIVHHLFCFFSFQFITFWLFINAVITDKDDESSKLNIWFTRCYAWIWGLRVGGVREVVSTSGYITWQRKLSRWICWHFFF